MAEVNMAKAKEVFGALVNMLDTRDWKYEKFEEDLVIKAGIKGEDLPIEFIVVVKPKNEVVQLLSRLPFTIPEEKRVDAAIAVCVVNDSLVDGSFDYDITEGNITFRLTSSYRESELGADLFEYMILVSAGTIDDYNDKFFMLGKNMMSVQDFFNKEEA